MISNPFFLLSILMSALLAFSTAAFIVEMTIRILRIHKYRVRSILRLLPFFSVFIDFAFNRFSIGNWLNPLSCESCIQKFVLQVFFPQLNNHLSDNQISLVRYLAFDGLNPLFSSVFILFCSLTAIFFVRKLYQVFLAYRSLQVMEKQEIDYPISIQNSQLEEALLKTKVRLLVNEKIKMPFVGYKPIIFIPLSIIKTLSSEELEAVIAHELEHVRFKDFFFKGFSQAIAALAWWIPLKSWSKTMEQELELACDEGAAKYGSQNEVLASAMIKLAKQTRKQHMEEICYFNHGKNLVLLRIQALLGLTPRKQKNLLWSIGIGIAVGGIIILGCLNYL